MKIKCETCLGYGYEGTYPYTARDCSSCGGKGHRAISVKDYVFLKFALYLRELVREYGD